MPFVLNWTLSSLCGLTEEEEEGLFLGSLSLGEKDFRFSSFTRSKATVGKKTSGRPGDDKVETLVSTS